MSNIHFVTGDILEDQSNALVNPVNCVGVMGAGLALQFRDKFPLNYVQYQNACNKKAIQPGRCLVCVEGRLIINFPTKVHWRDKSKIEYIEEGLQDIQRIVHAYQVVSIALPRLGCGLGGLRWEEVKPFMIRYLEPLPCKAYIYGPSDIAPRKR